MNENKNEAAQRRKKNWTEISVCARQRDGCIHWLDKAFQIQMKEKQKENQKYQQPKKNTQTIWFLKHCTVVAATNEIHNNTATKRSTCKLFDEVLLLCAE